MCAKRYEVQAPLVSHDDLLPPPDELTDLFINHIWRRFVGDLLVHFSGQVDFAGSENEIEQARAWYDALILDFYTGDEVQKFACRIRTLIKHDLLADVRLVVEWTDPALTPGAYDFGGFWSASNPTVLTVPTGGAGIYLVSQHVFWDQAPFSLRRMETIRLPGTRITRGFLETAGFWAADLAGQIELADGDEVQLWLESAVDVTVFNGPRLALARLFK